MERRSTTGLDGNHERITYLETFGDDSEQRWLQFDGGQRVLRAGSWRVLRIGSPFLLARLENHVDIDSVLRIECGARRALGKKRHVMTRFLSVHERIKLIEFALECIDGTQKPVDVMTKAFTRNEIEQHCKRLSVHERTELMTRIHCASPIVGLGVVAELRNGGLQTAHSKRSNNWHGEGGLRINEETGGKSH